METKNIKMHIAVVGCGHGEIDKIYEVVENIEKKRGIKVSLILCCGDFQSVRNMTDLRCMACPIKYQEMHDFHRYYSGEKKAPVPTLFIGGNHEASNYLQELPYGGYAAPNIYYMGYVGVVRFGPVRIAGLSGIYKGQDYLKGRYEAPPYDPGSMRSVYHYRNLDIFRLKQLNQHVDIMLSHDWPKGIHQYGNTEQLLRKKPFFRDEIERNELGSRPLFELMEKLQPSYWFAAHLHVKFAASVQHPCNNSNEEPSSDQTPVSEEMNAASSKTNQKTTKFLALDKVLPRRQFLQIIEIPVDCPVESLKLEHDPEWLAILKSTDDLISTKSKPCFMPGPGYTSRFDFTPTTEEIDEINELFQKNMEISESSFSQTGSVYQPGERPDRAFPRINPQTKEVCDKLGLTDPIRLAAPEHFINPLLVVNKSESSDQSWDNSFRQSQLDITYNQTSVMEDSVNPDEISLDLEEENECEKRFKDKDEPAKNPNRSRLVLPPPKCSSAVPSEPNSSIEVETNPESDSGPSAQELDILRSVMGDISGAAEPSTEMSSNLFFIDTQGDEQQPDVKRKKREELLRY